MSLPLGYLDRRETFTVTAVRISSVKEVKEGKPRLYRWIITPSDPVFKTPDLNLSDISQRIGLPLVVRKTNTPANDDLPFEGVVGIYHADPLAELFTACSPSWAQIYSSTHDFSNIPDEWISFANNETQAAIVARVDLQPLHPLHLAAILAFCNRRLRQDFATYRQNACYTWKNLPEEDPKRQEMMVAGRKRALVQVNRETFEVFCQEYKDARVRGLMSGKVEDEMAKWDTPIEEWHARPEWADVQSPWEV